MPPQHVCLLQRPPFSRLPVARRSPKINTRPPAGLYFSAAPRQGLARRFLCLEVDGGTTIIMQRWRLLNPPPPGAAAAVVVGQGSGNKRKTDAVASEECAQQQQQQQQAGCAGSSGSSSGCSCCPPLQFPEIQHPLLPQNDWRAAAAAAGGGGQACVDQSGLNNYFQVLLKLPNQPIPIETFNIYLTEGNYNVNTLVTEIKSKTNNAMFDISYDVKLNKYLFKNLFQPTFEVYIKPINSGIFLGFENGVEYKILPTGTYSSKFINISGYTHVIIKLAGDITIENTISNIYTNDYQYDKILGIISVSDIAPMDTITYEENSAGLFKHKVSNQKISGFSIQIVNENGDVFPQMTDWICILKFEKVKKKNKMENVESILSDINFYLMSLYSYLNIPSRITYDDLIQT